MYSTIRYCEYHAGRNEFKYTPASIFVNQVKKRMNATCKHCKRTPFSSFWYGSHRVTTIGHHFWGRPLTLLLSFSKSLSHLSLPSYFFGYKHYKYIRYAFHCAVSANFIFLSLPPSGGGVEWKRIVAFLLRLYSSICIGGCRGRHRSILPRLYSCLPYFFPPS